MKEEYPPTSRGRIFPVKEKKPKGPALYGSAVCPSEVREGEKIVIAAWPIEGKPGAFSLSVRAQTETERLDDVARKVEFEKGRFKDALERTNSIERVKNLLQNFRDSEVWLLLPEAEQITAQETAEARAKAIKDAQL